MKPLINETLEFGIHCQKYGVGASGDMTEISGPQLML